MIRFHHGLLAVGIFVIACDLTWAYIAISGADTVEQSYIDEPR